jgi:tRNA (cmo5U34)-methyltransferase
VTENKKDELYAAPLGQIGGFRFDEKVAEVFPDMINRSVPGYATIIELVGLLAHRFAQPDTHCYDLGCSLGATALSIHRAIDDRGCRVFAIDNSAPMLQRFREQAGDRIADIELVHADIADVAYENASLIALNFTLQFLAPDKRLALLESLRAGMVPGACLLLSEKVAFTQLAEEQFHEEMHALFKRANGYSELEVSQKRAALENVLIRDSVAAHHARLREAGFKRIYNWFQCFNFVSLVAFRD